jgi:SAM-dependent methyltransferase
MTGQGLKEYFHQHAAFQRTGGIFFQKNLVRTSDFERHYLPLRKQEGRLYDDLITAGLPKVPVGHPLWQEWIIRQYAADRLVSHLRKSGPGKLIEVGCGNGWLMNYLRESLNLDCAGIDMNVTELEQAERIFGHREGFTLVYGDILSNAFHSPLADVIVLASSIQYFPDLALVINKLLSLLRPSGEIHILDSPIYTTQEALQAKGRSAEYFRQSGHEAMTRYYFHHCWESLREFNYHLLYDPGSWPNKISKMFKPVSPFPWICISHSDF